MTERRTKLTDALVRVLCRLLTPIGVCSPRSRMMNICARQPTPFGRRMVMGMSLTVAVALLLAILTGRSDLCIAGVFLVPERRVPWRYY